MASDDHTLLMEALMFFSSGEDHDDNCSATTSDHETFGFGEASYHSPTGDDALLDTTLQQVLLGLEDVPAEPYGTPTHGKRSAPAAISPSTKQPLRRKRVKKCTYAARRSEVAHLRAATAQLEAQLQHLRKRARTSVTPAAQQREQELLAQSQAENARLRALVAANDARIRQAQAAGQRW